MTIPMLTLFLLKGIILPNNGFIYRVLAADSSHMFLISSDLTKFPSTPKRTVVWFLRLNLPENRVTNYLLIRIDSFAVHGVEFVKF